jgi:predicted membrane protein
MEEIINYISAHPLLITTVVFLVTIFLLNFIFKSLFKIILIGLAILMATVGYFYMTDPQKVPEPVKEMVETVKSSMNGFVDKSRSFYEDTKQLYRKGKAAPGDVNRMLEASKEEAGKK